MRVILMAAVEDRCGLFFEAYRARTISLRQWDWFRGMDWPFERGDILLELQLLFPLNRGNFSSKVVDPVWMVMMPKNAVKDDNEAEQD